MGELLVVGHPCVRDEGGRGGCGFGGNAKIGYRAIRRHFPRGQIEAASRPLG